MQRSLICEVSPQNTGAFLEHFKKTLKSYFGALHHPWILSLGVVSHENNVFVFSVSNETFFNTVKRNISKFEQIFCREYEHFFNSQCKVEVICNGEEAQIITLPESILKRASSNLDPKFTFQTFIATNENAFTKMHVESFTNKVREGQSGNLLCVTGAIGNGKTHLMQAVGNSVGKSVSVQYMTSERFMFLYTKSVSHKNLVAFRESITEAKLLLIDDIHFILAKEGTIKELASIIRYVLSFGGNVVITSAIPLHSIQSLPKDILDTFSKANVINIENPSKNLRYQILDYKNRAFGYSVSEEVLAILSDRISSNIRDLETTFDKVVLHGKILNNQIDVEAAKLILKEIFPTTSFKAVSIKIIIETVCSFYGIKKEDILSQSRLKEFVTARQMGMYLALEMTNETTKKIGFEFGGRTHSTVIHAYKAVKSQYEECNSETMKNLELLKVQIYSSS